LRIPRIDFLLFGYRKISLEAEALKDAINVFLYNGISVKTYGNYFLIREKDFPKISNLLSGKISYSASEPRGFFGFLKRNRTRYGVFFGIFFSLFLCLFLNSRVWDVRIEGSLSGNEKKIEEELSELGFGVGAAWRKVDKSRIEAEMLQSSENVSWININQRGSVAYVSVIDKISYEGQEEKEGYANIVASRDGIIEEISVESGYAVVKPGQTVKKGDLLISGVIPLENGGGFCYAKGVVLARYSDEISQIINKTVEASEEKERKLLKYTVKIFDFSFKIFKNYRKTEEKCDIIKEKQRISFFNLSPLPIFIEREYQAIYTEYQLEYTKEEMVKLASERMRDALNVTLKDKNLLKIRTEGKFLDGAYILTTEYVCESDISKCVEFAVSEKGK